MSKSAGFVLVSICTVFSGELFPQDGRIFRNTPGTRAVWEFNNFDNLVGEAPRNRTIVPDLSGNGNDAFVKNNQRSDIQVGA